MNVEIEKQYVFEDIMKKRKKDQEGIKNKIKTKLILKGKRKKNVDAIKSPEKIIKQYRAQQKAYSHYKLKNKLNTRLVFKGERANVSGVNSLLLVIRIRGVYDISKQQRIILSKLNLKKVNTAVFIKGTPANIRLLKKIENYITWGEPSNKIVNQLIYKKLYGKVGEERIQIKSNAQVQEHIGGEIICLEDIIAEIVNLGNNFTKIMQFIFPFKLTSPDGILASRLRKPVDDNGHWGYRGSQINDYVQIMI